MPFSYTEVVMGLDIESLKAACIADLDALPPVSPEAAAAFADKGMAMAARVTNLLAARPDLERLVGEGNQAMMEDNHKNHARYIASVLERLVPEQLVETIIWVYRAYRAHGFHLTYWPAQLNAWLEAMEAELDEKTCQEVEPLYTWMLNRQAIFVALSEQCATTWETPTLEATG